MTARPQPVLYQSTERPIDVLRRAYELRDAPAVEGFIRSNEHVARTLEGAREGIARVFGPDARPTIEVITDPENGHDSLLVVVQTGKSVPTSLAALHRFHEECWAQVGYEEGRLTAWTVG